MLRFPIALAILGLMALPALADVDPTSDATTPMDTITGNQAQPTDNTLSNAEVERLQQNAAHGVVTPPPAEDPSMEMPVGRPLAPAPPPGQPLENQGNSP
jgi:hypothetical protein